MPQWSRLACAGGLGGSGGADYETWDFGNFNPETPKQNEMLAGEYAREALKNGLALEERLDTNPYKFGMLDRIQIIKGWRVYDVAVSDGRTERLRAFPEDEFRDIVEAAT